VNDKRTRTFEIAHAYQVGPRVSQGPMACTYRGTWGTFDLPVYYRTYEKLAEVGLMAVDSKALLERLRGGKPPRGKHLPEVYEIFSSEDFVVAQAMRLPVGQTLFERLRSQEHMDLERTAHIVDGVAGALRACRAQGAPHRGPTADRVWIGEDNEVILLGYGEVLHYGVAISARSHKHPHLLWHAPPEAVAAAGTGSRTGSFSGVARARISDNQGVEETPQAEVYTLACLAHQCLRGVHPFFWEPTDASAGIEATLSPAPPPISTLAAGHPAVAVIEKGMLYLLQDRYEMLMEFVYAFHNAVKASAAPRTFTMPTGRIASVDVDDDDSGPQPIMADQRDDRDVESDEEPDRSFAGPVSPWWRAAALILLAGAVTALILNLTRPAALVILSDPPGVMLEEMVGHTAVELGETPVIIPRSNLLNPLLIRAVGPNGERGEPSTLQPSQFDDLGHCRSITLDLEAD
jgi:serine/threonine protein kinase